MIFHRSIADFRIREMVYRGEISTVYEAIDLQSGIRVAIKAYQRSELSDFERRQVRPHGSRMFA